MLAVVVLAHDDGAVDVAVHKVDQHFRARTRGEHRAPVGAGAVLRHAHPGAAALVARGVAGAGARRGGGGAQGARQRRGAALPCKLHAHTAIAVGAQGLALGGHHLGRLQAGRGGFMQRQRCDARTGWNSVKAVAVAALFQLAGLQDAGGFGAQVVGRLVGDAQHGKGVVCTPAIQAVIGDAEGGRLLRQHYFQLFLKTNDQLTT